ncbi:DinB family protein [Pelagibacterium xiamenense]|uniref:DinB family protein n=1 Tax=Pelagibacterium xiamenense TaxID=2901140 RepID=UPI001E5D17F1|nr:DinB family protein [Pelagibacterium xiamenense]MCD7058474.1 DinB family protein [Pelagibacterium xiamenense]
MIAPDPARVFRKLAVNNALANYRLAQAVIALPQAEFEAKRTSFFPSLKETLNHILVVDWFYLDALKDGELGLRAFDNEEPFATAETLYAAQRESDLDLFALTRTLVAEALAAPIKIQRTGRIQIERLDDVLSHLFQHQTHHRGQAHAMLAGTAMKPPQLDEFIVADDAIWRAGELAAFGWTEDTLEFEDRPGDIHADG